jgi:glycosyltransferase involved in cell wall biosynthesis
LSQSRHDHEAADWSRLAKRPDISVGIVTYNHEPYLAQALDSVLEQEVSCSYEIVVYEDCSTDNTRQIALDYQRRFPDRIRVVYSERNLGVAENVRRGLPACRGRYLAGLDGDDFWTDPLKLQKQFEALEARPGVNLCITRGHRLMPDGRMEVDWDYGDHDRTVPQRELLGRGGMVFPSGSAFYRAAILHGSPDWIFDAPVMDFFHMLAGTSPGGAFYLARDCVAYRIMSIGSWSHSQNDQFDTIKVHYSRRMLDHLRLAGREFRLPRSTLRFVTSGPHLTLGRDALSRGNVRLAFHHLRQISLHHLIRLVRAKIRAAS